MQRMIEEPTPTKNEITPSTRVKTNIATMCAIIALTAVSVGGFITVKRDIADVVKEQDAKEAQFRDMNSKLQTIHENMLRLTYSIDPALARTMKPLPPATATP